MTRHVLAEDIKEKIVTGNAVSNNITGAQTLDVYINELLLENKRNLTLSHKESLQGNLNKLDNILGLFSRLTVTMVLEEVALEVLHINDRDSSSITQISALFEQTILLFGYKENPDYTD